MDNFVQGKVSIFLSRPVPREEAIKIIEINLLMNGYSLVPAEGDIVKVIGANKSPRNAGVAIISDEADIPAGEQVISFLFKLRITPTRSSSSRCSRNISSRRSLTRRSWPCRNRAASSSRKTRRSFAGSSGLSTRSMCRPRRS